MFSDGNRNCQCILRGVTAVSNLPIEKSFYPLEIKLQTFDAIQYVTS